jgi:hypothetical protein
MRPLWWCHVHHPSSLFRQFCGKLGNSSLTCVLVKQAARSRRVSHIVLPYRFCGAADKPSSAWFWGSNQKTVAVILRPKLSNWSCSFEAQTEKLADLGFETQLKNSCPSSTCARYRPHTASPDLPIIRSPSTRSVLDHLRSSVLGLILLCRSSLLSDMSHMSPTHYETNKHDFSHKIDCNRTTKMSRIQIKSMTYQWFITIKPKYTIKLKYWPLHLLNIKHENLGLKKKLIPNNFVGKLGAGGSYNFEMPPIVPKNGSEGWKAPVTLRIIMFLALGGYRRCWRSLALNR